MAGHHLAETCSHSSSANGDEIYSISSVTSQDHLTNGLYDSTVGAPSGISSSQQVL